MKTWSDLFDAKVKDDLTVLDVLIKAFLQGEENTVAVANSSMDFPKSWAVSLIFQEINGIEANLNIHLYGAWTKYRAYIEAMVVNGSYCLSNETFQGDIAGPWLDTQSEHPGEQWKEIVERDFTLPVNSLVNILYGSKDIDILLRDKLGPVLLK
jgi:hypothetical protein